MSEAITLKKEGIGIFTKLLSGFLLILAITSIGHFYSYNQLNRLSDLVTKIFNHPLKVTTAVLSADVDIVKIHRSMKDVALSTSVTELQNIIDIVNVKESEVFDHLGVAKKWILGDEGATLVSDTTKLFHDWKPIRDEVIALTMAGKKSQAFAITKGKGADHVELLNSKMKELKNYAAKKASDMLADSKKTKKKIISATTSIFLILVIVSGLFGFFLSRTITGSIKQLIKGVVEFGRGNLDYQVKVKNKDEIKLLAIALNNMAALRRITEKELFKSREHLEEIVKERTIELEKEIDERTKAEEELHRSAILLESSIESPTDMIILSLDREYRYLYFNKTHKETMTHFLGTKPEVGHCIFDFIKNKVDIEKIKAHYDRALAGEGHIVIEEYGEDQLANYYEIRYNPVYDEKNEIIGVTSFAQNITERIQIEEQLKASLKEKETLLYEIHHRVKNNMSVISSLLALQMNSTNDQIAQEALQDSQNRVQSMSMIHETLYRSDNLSAIDLKTYLSELGRTILQNYSINDTVHFKVEAENTMISVKLASPVGLIVNELISNSLKYAFPDDRVGEIVLELKSYNESEFELTVSDNGIGIPDSFDFEKVDSLGLKLVKMLVENQLDGLIDMEGNNGTRFTIKFNIA